VYSLVPGLLKQKPNQPQAELPESKGRVIGFVSAKGGCGATTVACHIAAEIETQAAVKVLLADYDLDAGVIGYLMRAECSSTLLNAAEHAHSLEPSGWNSLVTNFRPNLDTLKAPVRRYPDEECKIENLSQVLRFARTQYEFTVVDLGRGLTPIARSVLKEIDVLYLVTTFEMPSFFQAKQLIQSLLLHGCDHFRIRAILNRARPSDPTLEELQEMLTVPVLKIPNFYATVAEAFEQRTLVPAAGALGKSFAHVAKKVAGLGTAKQSGVLSRFAQKMSLRSQFSLETVR